MKDSSGTGEGRRSITSDEYLTEVTIGSRQALNSTIHPTPFDPQWKSEFERHAHRIRDALGEKVQLLEHVDPPRFPSWPLSQFPANTLDSAALD